MKQRSLLIGIAKKYTSGRALKPKEINCLLTFTSEKEDSNVMKWVKQLAFPASIFFGFLFATFSSPTEAFVKLLPSWTNMPDNLLAGVDYLWNFFGEPIGKNNILFHLPNIILYTASFFGIKTVYDAVARKTWLDKVLEAQSKLKENVAAGNLKLDMKLGHSLLFVGSGDFIGTQFSLNHANNESLIISDVKPTHTIFWNHYHVDSLYQSLVEIVVNSDGKNAGEFVFFPVKDDQIFLPGPTAYDLPPHKIDILCQNLRTLEKNENWKPKKIIIIGDKHHQSFVQSINEDHVIENTQDIISLESISKKYVNTLVLDPSEIVLKKIMEISQGREIVFRATEAGISEYKDRFYNRLKELGYKPDKKIKGTLTIGYDIFEDQTEQQTLSRSIDDYYPVVLSKNVKDALLRNGYKESEFIYVPDVVLAELGKTVE